MYSILTSIKKLLGIEEDYEHFDVDIIMLINSVFVGLTQMGVGPPKGFSISDKSALWSDFISDSTIVEAVKTYTYLKVKLLFDPPANSAITESINRMISELEFRITIGVEDDSYDDPTFYDKIELKDISTGTHYKLYIDDSKLSMSEVKGTGITLPSDGTFVPETGV